MNDYASAQTTARTARTSVIQLSIKERAALYAAYMSTYEEGGLFFPSKKDFKLGDEVYLLVTLPNDPTRYPLFGTVCWVTPEKGSRARTQGAGVRFPGDPASKALQEKIVAMLGKHLTSDRPTQTV